MILIKSIIKPLQLLIFIASLSLMAEENEAKISFRGSLGKDITTEIFSPNKKYIFKFYCFTHEVTNAIYGKVQIYDSEKKLLYDDHDYPEGNQRYGYHELSFGTWFTNIFAWENDDRVWLYSGDLGLFYWEIKDGKWKRNKWNGDSGLKIPDSLELGKDRLESIYKH